MAPLSNGPIYMILLSAFMMGLAGGLHCIGMCGPLAMSCNQKSHRYVYQLGRLVSYSLLGIIAGFFGHGFQNYFEHPLTKLVPTLFLCLIFIVWGISIYFNKKISLPVSFKGSRLLQKMLGRAYSKPAGRYRSFSIGLFSVLLPCGMLYGVLISLTIFNNPFIGGLGMALFALGSAPSLLFSPMIISKVLKPIKDSYPKHISLGLISLGLITILYRGYSIYGQATQCH